MKTAKQLRAEFTLIKPNPDSVTQFEPFYQILPEQLDTYVEAVCREQVRLCAIEQDNGNPVSMTPQPETK